jgi:hypothetical protein
MTTGNTCCGAVQPHNVLAAHTPRSQNTLLLQSSPPYTSSEPHPAKLLHDCYCCYSAAGLLLVLLLVVAAAAAAGAAEARPATVDRRRPLGCTLPHAEHSTRSTPDAHAARDARKRRPAQPKPLLLRVAAAASAAGSRLRC